MTQRCLVPAAAAPDKTPAMVLQRDAPVTEKRGRAQAVVRCGAQHGWDSRFQFRFQFRTVDSGARAARPGATDPASERWGSETGGKLRPPHPDRLSARQPLRPPDWKL